MIILNYPCRIPLSQGVNQTRVRPFAAANESNAGVEYFKRAVSVPVVKGLASEVPVVNWSENIGSTLHNLDGLCGS